MHGKADDMDPNNNIHADPHLAKLVPIPNIILIPIILLDRMLDLQRRLLTGEQSKSITITTAFTESLMLCGLYKLSVYLVWLAL